MNYLKILLKVPLVLLENFAFLLFPQLRVVIEKYLYNPLDFKQQHIKYSQNKFQEFLKTVQLYTSLPEKVLLELGPGGSLGFGILSLEEKLATYIAIDDGLHSFIKKNQLAGYRELLGSENAHFSDYFEHRSGQWQYNSQKIKSLIINQESKYPLEDASVDIIYSCAVLEHVHNLDLCFREMTRVLKNKGLMYHEVDLRDHIFSQESLYFLGISDFWFYCLFSKTGAFVNRKRLSYYKDLATKNNLDILSLTVTKRYTGSYYPASVQQLSQEDRKSLVFTITLKKNAPA